MSDPLFSERVGCAEILPAQLAARSRADFVPFAHQHVNAFASQSAAGADDDDWALRGADANVVKVGIFCRLCLLDGAPYDILASVHDHNKTDVIAYS